MPKKTVLLTILDGWGISETSQHNPIQQSDTPFIDNILKQYPHTELVASGDAVGLPAGQIGNSEVGHLHIGAGRRIPQTLTRINESITNGSFAKNPIFLEAIAKAKAKQSAVHLIGLLSPGGVHSHENHIMAMIQLLIDHGVQKHYLHALLDGRDVAPQSALASIQKIDALYKTIPTPQSSGKDQNIPYKIIGNTGIASIMGRYYAMDRDNRWQRTQAAYDLLTNRKTDYHAETAEQGLALAYERNETDEFVKPTSIHRAGQTPAVIGHDDVIIFMNFRADRARQLCQAFLDPAFDGFVRTRTPQLSEFVSLTQYASDLTTQVAFPPQAIANTLGEYLSQHGKTQLRAAETEKYAHVTYFLNGGQETPFPGEERILVPSPKVATYDLAPSMNAQTLTQKLIKAINSQQFDVIICNYANPDMIGHTGVVNAAQIAVETIDTCLSELWHCVEKNNGEMLITADHGNIECIYDEAKQQPHTAHTSNPVPFIYLGSRQLGFVSSGGSLADIAPSLLYLLDLIPPVEMTGKNLFV